MPRFLFATTALLVAGCVSNPRQVGDINSTGGSAGDESDGDRGSNGDDSGGDGTSGRSGSEGDGDGDGDGDDATGSGGDGGIKLDVGDGAASATAGEEGSCDPDTDEDCGCTAVDILFVVDNSLSMGVHQAALRDAFPSISDAMFSALPPGTDLHVGVTTTEFAYASSGGSGPACMTGPQGGTLMDVYQTPDQVNTGVNGAQGRLRVVDGRPYYAIETDAPQAERDMFLDWFGRAIVAGESGSNIEMSSGAAGWVGDPANADTNGGFLRDEGAVYAVIFIQDEHDQTPPEVSQDLIDRIAAQKAACGGMRCVIGGGFIGQYCTAPTQVEIMLDAFSESFVEELAFSFGMSSVDFVPQLTSLLSDVAVEKCSQIPPPVG